MTGMSARSSSSFLATRIVLLTIMLGSGPAMAALVPPEGYTQAIRLQKPKPYECLPTPQPFTRDLDFTSQYEGSGPSRDEFNENAKAEHDRQTATISAMEKGVASMVTKYARSGNPAQLACITSWLDTWAKAHALEAKALNHQGRSVRKWTLASLASSYLRLKFSETAPLKSDSERAGRIEAWFSRLADQVLVEWPPDSPIEKINNHFYWAAWSLMATAIICNRKDLYDRSLVFYRLFETQIDADGFLPNEVKRRTRALGYHAYALAPITMIAAFGKANGVDLADEGNGALGRLAHRVASGLDDPSSFETRAGAAQDPHAMSEKGKWIWLEPYCWTTSCDSSFKAKLDLHRPQRSTRLGGDLTAIFAKGDAS